MNSANDKYGSSLDRPPSPGKPVDPATRLSELLAQSLEELTRPFDPPQGGGSPHPARTAPAAPAQIPPHLVAAHAQPEPEPERSPEETRIDADKALAELEAELFAAARQVDAETPATPPAEEAPVDEGHATPPAPDDRPRDLDAPHDLDQPVAALSDQPSEEKPAEGEREIPLLLKDEDLLGKPEAAVDAAPLAPEEPAAPLDADAERLVARVRRLMLVSMGITIVAVGSVFGLIGYRVMTSDGVTAKTADKLPPASAIPTDITLSLPRGARIIQSAVVSDRLVMTMEIDGKVEVRTFDVTTLQPAGRLNFSAAP
jgi:hypothetical protein